MLTRAEVIRQLQDHARRRGSPTARWLVRHDALTYRSLLVHFASVSAARAAAVVAVPRRRRRWSRARVLDELRRLGRRRDLKITAKGLADAGYAGLVSAARTYLRSLPRARRLAGLPDPPFAGGVRERWDDDRVIHEIQHRHRAKLPLAVTKVPRKLVDAACKYCGSWGEAIEMAGLDYEAVRLRRAAWRRDDVLVALRVARNRNSGGGSPGRPGAVLSRHARRWFGSLRDAALAAGVDPEALRRRVRWTRQDVVDGLRRLARDRPALTITELRRMKLGVAAERRFGSVVTALERADIEHWPRRDVAPLPSRQELLRELRARRRRGDPLRYTDVAAQQPRLHRAVRKHFGSWSDALEAAGIRAIRPR